MPRIPSLVALILAASLHLVGLVRCDIPSQDGLAFIRQAQAYVHQPWETVVRDSDQHPLYPVAIALLHPAVERLAGVGPDSWRIAAQAVAVSLALLTLVPLAGLTRRLFGSPVDAWALLLWVALPFPMAVGHDTLSDAPALFCLAMALWCGQRAWQESSRFAALACGVFGGLGFLVRPEAAVVPLIVAAVAFGDRSLSWWSERNRPQIPADPARTPALRGLFPGQFVWAVALLAPLLITVAGYSTVKGTISTKLVWRGWSEPIAAAGAKPVGHALPTGLDASTWDFSPKEEDDLGLIRSNRQAIVELGRNWAAGLGWVLVPLGVLGWVRARPQSRTLLLTAFLAFEALMLVAHGRRVGYLSARHALPLVFGTVPWVAAYVQTMALRIVAWRTARSALGNRLAWGLVGLILLVGVFVQLRLPASHASRAGHRDAGRWIARVAEPGEAILDTRGWASFVSNCRAYDYWHVRQALTDARLGYVVVGADELEATSPRAETLRAILDYSSSLAATFPAPAGIPGHDVLVYRFRRPDSWEGLTR